MLFDSGMGIGDMHYGHDCYPFEGFSIVLSGYPCIEKRHCAPCGPQCLLNTEKLTR